MGKKLFQKLKFWNSLRFKRFPFLGRAFGPMEKTPVFSRFSAGKRKNWQDEAVPKSGNPKGL
jgi:hypothetical protein